MVQVQDATSRSDADLPEKEEDVGEEDPKPSPESEETAVSSESPETPKADKEDVASLQKRLKGYDKALKESREREKALEAETLEAKKSGMSVSEATQFELETSKRQIQELQQSVQYYEGELAKRDILKGYKHASQFQDLLYGTPEEMKEQADRLEKYVEKQHGGSEEEEQSPPPVDRDLPPLEREEEVDEEFAKLSTAEMRKRLPIRKR